MKSKGLGDTIEKITKGNCGCEKRKLKLNKLFPYGKAN